MLEPWMFEYDLRAYGAMQGDSVRMEAYVAALRSVVRPSSVVLDLGTGAGAMALLAARMGARRVIAVDTSPVITVARMNAESCGLADRIEFIQGDSRRLTLAEPADVIVSDLRGVLPPLHHDAAVLADARDRLLAPGGVLIPLRDELLVAPVHLPEEYQRLTGPWSLGDLELQPAREIVLNEWRRAPVTQEALLAEPAVWYTLDYPTVGGAKPEGSAIFAIESESLGHGLAGWFRAELVPGVGYTSGPGSSTVYGTAFFPWPRPVRLQPGDRIQVGLSVHAPGTELVWVWRTRIQREGEADVVFRQSPAAVPAVSLPQATRRAAPHVPGLGRPGAAALQALEAAGAGASLGEIAEKLLQMHPDLFNGRGAALTFAAELLDRYGA